MTIRLEDVQVALGENEVLRGVSLTFKKGLNFVLGLNGSGKTTLIRCLGKSVAYQGNIWIDQLNLSNLTQQEFAQTISVVHQNWTLPFRITVQDFVLMGRFPYLNWLGSYTEEDWELVFQQMKLLQIEHLKDRFLDQISGGERQRVFLSRSMAQNCPIMLLDEPAQSLDPPAKIELYALLTELAKTEKTVICSSHDIWELPLNDSYLIGIKDGKLVFEGSPTAMDESLKKIIYG